jgi:hypothetical protein
VRAERVGGAGSPGAGHWRLDGVAPWYTGWGLNDVALVGGMTSDGEVVLALVPARPAAGVTASAPMRTAALQAAATVTLTFDDHRVAADDVVSVQPVAGWAERDRNTTVNARPAVFGLTTAALGLLERRGVEHDEPEAVAAAGRLGERAALVREQAYRLLDDVPPELEHGRTRFWSTRRPRWWWPVPGARWPPGRRRSGWRARRCSCWSRRRRRRAAGRHCASGAPAPRGDLPGPW